MAVPANDPTRDAIRAELKAERRRRRGNVQGVGCLMVMAALPLAALLPYGGPFGALIGLVGLVVLIVGLFV